jgi:N-acetylglucosamine-6-phosphate deacetylase
MSDHCALTATRLFDAETWHENAALVVRGGHVEGIVARRDLPPSCEVRDLGGGIIAPGFVDLQVNGGGGVMLNDRPDPETIETICRAHARYGTTALMVTLITDTRDITEAAIDATAQAHARGMPGLLGLHLEGPHLSLARKGAHDPALIRPMDDEDQHRMIAARTKLPHLLMTLAPEAVAPERIAALAAAGVIVSIGHSDTSYAEAKRAAAAGARMVTHIFNAMSQIGSREPGVAGAALDTGSLWAGLIADGIHVDPVTTGIALRAKQGPGRIFLVTDAMATIGTGMKEFKLNGRTIRRENGRLTLEDGTLAGADLDMISAVRFMHQRIGLDLSEALRMASTYPAQAMGVYNSHGRLTKGARADIVHLSDALDVEGVWIGGEKAV